MKLQCRNIRWMKRKNCCGNDNGQRTKNKGHRISQSVIKNEIGVTKYGIKILVWKLLCKVGGISPPCVMHLYLSHQRSGEIA